MTEHVPDQLLDAQLRQTPVPEELGPRLREIAALTDRELDSRLQAIATPAALLGRLRQIVADERLDDRLREVPLPTRVLVGNRRPAGTRGVPHWASWTVAAALLIAVGGGYLAVARGLFNSVYPWSSSPESFVLKSPGDARAGQWRDALVSLSPGWHLDAEASDAELAATEAELLESPLGVTADPAADLMAEIPRHQDRWGDLLSKQERVLGSADLPSRPLPELKTVPFLTPHGFAVPLHRGFDREFLYRRGTHPPAMLAADKAAGLVSAPLTSDTSSFDLTRRVVAAGHRPEPQEVRVEDFVAAMPLRLPPAPAGRLAIRTAAGPSVFNPAADGLLHVAVAAGEAERPARLATHLTIALDISDTLQSGGRLELVQRALEGLAQHLRPSDRLSLVLFREQALPAFERARGDDLGPLYRILDQLHGEGVASVAAGLRQAVATAESLSAAEFSPQVVMLTGNCRGLSKSAAAELQTLLAQAHQRGVGLRLLDLSAAGEADAALGRLLQAAGGTARPVHTAAEVRWALVEALTGAAALVASDARLEVEFNPRAVAAYRLLGHEATALGGLLPATVNADLHVGESASVLFELWLYPNAEDDLAVARLQWRPPHSEAAVQRVSQRISRVQFATSFEGAPLPLQAAALAAETGEVLRQAYDFAVPAPGTYRFRPKSSNLSGVLRAAERVSPALAEQPGFRRFLAVVDQANRLAPERRLMPAKPGARVLADNRWE